MTTRWLVHTGRHLGFMGREVSCVDGLLELKSEAATIHVYRDFCSPISFIAGDRVLVNNCIQGEVEEVDGERLVVAAPCRKYRDATIYTTTSGCELVTAVVA